jgi:hypothetical protein
MKLKVFNEQPREEKEPEVTLRLESTPHGDVVVLAVDSEGNRVNGGSLLAFKADGTILRPAFVNPKLPFKLDDMRRIQINGDDS